MPNIVWEDGMYLDVFRLAKSGLSNSSIAKSIGVTPKTFSFWLKRKPTLKKALEEGRAPPGEVSRTFQDYIFNRLPKRLRKVWRRLKKCSDSNQVERMEALLDKQGTRGRQELFIHAFIASGFNASEACRMVVISYSTMQRWIKNDPDFGELMNEMEFHKEEFFENALIQKVIQGDTKAIIFAAKSKLHKRGYGETKQINKTVTVQGMVGHVPFSVDDLNLSLEARKEMLEKVRMKQLGPVREAVTT
jgi:transposase